MSKLLLGIVREGRHLIRVLRPLTMAMVLANALAGCGSDHSADGNSFLFSANAPSLLLHGSVLGGRQPIVGSSVLIMAASTQNATTAWTQIAAATTDSLGNYEIQSFSAEPSDGDLIYAISVGGDAGGGTNNNAVLLSMFGTYSASTKTVSSTYAIINEATTVAMLETFAGNLELISRCAVSSGVVSCPSSWSGVANTPITYPTATAGSIPINLPRPQQLGGGDWSSAVTTFNHYVNASTDGQPSSNLSDNTLQTVNMMASVLANCVNSSGGVAGDTSACGNLFSLSIENINPATPNTVSTTSTSATYAQLNEFSYTGYSVPSVPGTVVSMVTSPSGQFLYVLYKDTSGGNHLSAFNFDNSTGQISAMSSVGGGSASVSTAAGTALSLAISPDGQTLYAANSDVHAKVSAVSINSEGSLNPNIVVHTLTNPTTANTVSLSPDGTGLAVVYQTKPCPFSNGTDLCDHMSYWSVTGTAITQPPFWGIKDQILGVNTAGSLTTSVWLPNRQKFSGYNTGNYGSRFVLLSAEQATVTGTYTGLQWFVFPTVPTSGSFDCVAEYNSCLQTVSWVSATKAYVERSTIVPAISPTQGVNIYFSVGGGSHGDFLNGISKILPADDGTTNFVMGGKNHSWSFSYKQYLADVSTSPLTTGPIFVGATLGSFGGSPAGQGFALTKGSQYLYELGGTAATANVWQYDLTADQNVCCNVHLGYAAAGPNVLTPNGRFLIVADSSANMGLHVLFSSRAVPTDIIAALYNLITAANRSTTGNNGATALFGLAPVNPVYGTWPSQVPASLIVQ